MKESFQTGDQERHNDLVRWNRKTRRDVQEALTEPIVSLAKRIEEFVIDEPSLVKEHVSSLPLDCVPYSVASLPPNLFEYCGNPQPFIPNTEEELETFMESYWPHNRGTTRKTRGIFALELSDRNALKENLQRRRGTEIDPKAWEQYQTAYGAQLQRDFYTLGQNAADVNSVSNLKFNERRGIFEFATGRYKNFLLTNNDSTHRITQLRRVPIGAYGLTFAEQLLQTAIFIDNFTEHDSLLENNLTARVDKYGDVLSSHTSRGHFRNYVGPEKSQIVGIQEGVTAILATICHSTAEIVPGYKNPDDLIAKVVKDHMPDQITKLAPLAIAEPTLLHGLYFPGLVDASEESLTVSNPTKEILARMKQQGEKIDHEVHRKYQEDPETSDKLVRTGLICPFTGKYLTAERTLSDGAIRALTQTFGVVYKCINTP